jgi:hypothetical protein
MGTQESNRTFLWLEKKTDEEDTNFLHLNTRSTTENYAVEFSAAAAAAVVVVLILVVGSEAR